MSPGQPRPLTQSDTPGPLYRVVRVCGVSVGQHPDLSECPSGPSSAKPEIIVCPLCRSPNVVHRGGSQRQCVVCHGRFTVTASGSTENGFSQWLESRKRKAGLTKQRKAGVQ